MRHTCLQEREHLIFTLSFLELLVRGDVSDADDLALFVVEEEALKADLDF